MGFVVSLSVTRIGSLPAMLMAMVGIESLSGVTQGYLNPLLPALGPVFHIGDPAISELYLISNVSFAVLTPILSRLGDSYGYRPVLRWSTVVVALAALLMSVLPTLTTIVVGIVALTGVGGFIPLMMGLLRAVAPVRVRTGVGVLVGTLLVTTSGGGLLAGLVGVHDPRLGFRVAVPFAVAAVICSFILPDGGISSREPLPLLPLVACSLGLIGAVVTLSMGPEWSWSDPEIITVGATGALLYIWIRLDLRSAATTGHRFLNLRMLQDRRIRVATGSTFLFGFASIGYLGINGIFLHANPDVTGYGYRFSPFAIAVVTAAASCGSLPASLATTRLLARFGAPSGFVAAGALLAGGFLTMALGHRYPAVYIVGLALFNLAMGSYQTATRALSVEGVPKNETSSAAGLNELALSVGAAVGAAVITFLSAAFVSPSGRITETGLPAIWTVLGLAAMLAGMIGAAYPRATRAVAEEFPT